MTFQKQKLTTHSQICPLWIHEIFRLYGRLTNILYWWNFRTYSNTNTSNLDFTTYDRGFILLIVLSRVEQVCLHLPPWRSSSLMTGRTTARCRSASSQCYRQTHVLSFAVVEQSLDLCKRSQSEPESGTGNNCGSTNTYICACMCTCVRVCAYECMYICVCTYSCAGGPAADHVRGQRSNPRGTSDQGSREDRLRWQASRTYFEEWCRYFWGVHCLVLLFYYDVWIYERSSWNDVVTSEVYIAFF